METRLLTLKSKILLEKLRITAKFALQINESMDISGHAQLMAKMCFVNDDIRDNFVLQTVAREREHFSKLNQSMLNKED